ncbi:dihydrolipoyl dehydrogenase family protein [Roseomonas sp. CCTCC AB2023176]|uniref:dihydrolipoyl dehydrogenase family protein n=1 Tax=Roseomonas sp. CCTCC AB2023176 TaxID=3342640 RepID=UPI0035D919B1
MIGAGAAGLSITFVAAGLGLRVAIFERARMGGDCLNNGCVPSKALLTAARVARDARRAARYGIRLPEPEVDWDALRAHVHGAIETIAPMDSEERYRGLGAEVVRAEVRFASPGTLIAAGRSYAPRRIVVAAGSRAAIPPIPGLAETPHLTNETLFEMRERPAHLLILGGGAIGTEMAQAHAALGCQVTLVEATRLLNREDPDLAAVIRDALVEDGVTIIEDTKVTAVEPGPTLVLEDGRRITGTHLLVAVGRRANIDDLGLDAGNVAHTLRGVATDAGLRSTTNPRVFASGDIADPEGIGPRQFTHVGSFHATILARRMIFRLPARLDYAALPRVTYTDPELASVGLTAEEARKSGQAVQVLDWPMHENDRAIAEGRPQGLARLVVSKRGKLLGAGIAAPHAGEMIGLLTHAVAKGLPASALTNLIVPYPTRAEAVKRAAGRPGLERLFAAGPRWVARRLMALG